MKNFFLILLVSLILSGNSGCRKSEQNKIDIDQIDIDNSNNYRYMFREEIQKESAEKRKREQTGFKD